MTPHVPFDGLDHKQVKSEDELPLETPWSDEHECVPLKQRLKMLRVKAVSKNRDEILISPVSPIKDVVVKKEDDLCDSLDSHSNANDNEIVDFQEDLDNVVLKERQRMLLLRKSARSIRPAMEHTSPDPSTNPVDMILQNTGIESGGTDTCGTKSAIRENVTFDKGDAKVKVEPLDYDLEIPNKSLGSRISIKSEPLNNSENIEDIIDHMLLGDRMRLLALKKFPTSILSDHKSTVSKSSKPIVIKPPRKRRKTVTDSVETALEEDAPGLLQVLVEKGVVVDEIKLYGESMGDEPLDESMVEESFSELEEVITKIFSQRQSLFKFAPIRCARGEKASYCLSCLVALVEQVRYLRVKKWPVEWGWCRDLQSFIFVFEKHNRIVLERPEYGYATYFFEVVDTLPVHWQIKRLVTAMKLTSCSRITLIENRALTVGDDLTEGEARVLMEYGWIPNSGLGTMLNYCDRVVHDRKNDSESDSSEWRSKIGKLLTDGYNGGIIVPNDIPKKVMEYGACYSPEIKLEY